jgi:site-specific DNA-methyltransferase (adenine-specific)
MIEPECIPIVVAYKPGGKRELQIDECRIPGVPAATRCDSTKHSHEGWRFNETGEETYARTAGRGGEKSASTRYGDKGSTNFSALPGPRGGSIQGRWPSNLVHDGSEGVLELFPSPHSAGAACDPRFPIRTKNAIYGSQKSGTLSGYRVGDTGSTARFFYSTGEVEGSSKCHYTEEDSAKQDDRSIRVDKILIGDAVLFQGDCREVCQTLDYVDAIVTDPPYHLVQGQGKNKGFMGQQWDGGDLAFNFETWGAIGDCLKPGGYLLAFGGTRTYHRMVCAIEDAGFVIQDCIMWVFGQGFPKGKTALKPSYEPIVVAYKEGGKRELQIDECRISGPAGSGHWTNKRDIGGKGIYGGGGYRDVDHGKEKPKDGRWPANLVHDGSDEVLGGFPHTKSGTLTPEMNIKSSTGWAGGSYADRVKSSFSSNEGSAARFFYQAKASRLDRAGSSHPTIKPQKLMEWLVKLVTPPGGTVLDPFAGSGSTGQAALAVGRKPILIENDPQWFADSCHRIEQYQDKVKTVDKQAVLPLGD